MKIEFTKKKERVVKSYPCSNRPVNCEQCNAVFWSYKLEFHYKSCHKGLTCPNMITEEERRLVLQ